MLRTDLYTNQTEPNATDKTTVRHTQPERDRPSFRRPGWSIADDLRNGHRVILLSTSCTPQSPPPSPPTQSSSQDASQQHFGPARPPRGLGHKVYPRLVHFTSRDPQQLSTRIRLSMSLQPDPILALDTRTTLTSDPTLQSFSRTRRSNDTLIRHSATTLAPHSNPSSTHPLDTRLLYSYHLYPSPCVHP